MRLWFLHWMRITLVTWRVCYKSKWVCKAAGAIQDIFGMKLSWVIFGPTEELCCTLRRKNTTIQEDRNAALVTEVFYISKEQMMHSITSMRLSLWVKGSHWWACSTETSQASSTLWHWCTSLSDIHTQRFLVSKVFWSIGYYVWGDQKAVWLRSEDSCWYGKQPST